MQPATQQTAFARLRALVPNGRAVKEFKPSRHQPDDLDKAREKVIDKLRVNKRFVEGGQKIADGERAPDRTFVRQANGDYTVGVKYGNRWLEGIFEGNVGYYIDVSDADLGDAIGILIEQASAGEFDTAIEAVRKANLAAKGNLRS